MKMKTLTIPGNWCLLSSNFGFVSVFSSSAEKVPIENNIIYDIDTNTNTAMRDRYQRNFHLSRRKAKTGRKEQCPFRHRSLDISRTRVNSLHGRTDVEKSAKKEPTCLRACFYFIVFLLSNPLIVTFFFF